MVRSELISLFFNKTVPGNALRGVFDFKKEIKTKSEYIVYLYEILSVRVLTFPLSEDIIS